MRSAVFLLLVSATLWSCGGGAGGRHVVEPRHVAEDSDRPSVARVVDLGAVASIPSKGPISTAQSDGHFVIGELVLIEGDDFGKLPAISIGRHPVESIARTRNGGILVRIPSGISSGQQPVEVSHRRGRDSILIGIERLGMIGRAGAGTVHFFTLESSGAVTKGPVLESKGLVDLTFSHDGQAAYLASKDSVAVVAMSAPGGPRFLSSYPVKGDEIQSLVSGVDAPILVVLGAATISTFDIREPTAISEAGRMKVAGGAHRGVISPDGERLALLSRDGNQLLLIDISDAENPSLVGSIALLEGEIVPLTRDLAFSPLGDEIWVVAGDNERSVAAGTRPTTLSVIKKDGDSLSLASTSTISSSGAPRNLAVSRREAIMAAAAVRSTAQKAAIVLTTAAPSLMAPDAKASTSSELGQLLAIDLDGGARVLSGGKELHTNVVLSHEHQFLIAATRRIDGAGNVLGISIVPVAGGTPTFVMFAEDREARILSEVPLALMP